MELEKQMSDPEDNLNLGKSVFDATIKKENLGLVWDTHVPDR